MLNLADLYLFENVVKFKSFTQAAPHVYLTPQALTHRINKFEQEIGAHLFNRSAQGVNLTPAGKTLADKANNLLVSSQNLLQEVQAADSGQQIIRVGTSVINPAQQIAPYLSQTLAELPNHQVQYIPLETLNALFPDFYQQLGSQVDLMFGPSGFLTTKQATHFIKLTDLSFAVTMHARDPLAKKKSLSLQDLNEKTLLLPPYHGSQIIDQLYDLIHKEKRPIKLRATDLHYSISTFNNFAKTNDYLWSLPCWQEVLPGLVTGPITTDFTIPYGIMTPKKPKPAVKKFVDVLEKTISQAKADE